MNKIKNWFKSVGTYLKENELDDMFDRPEEALDSGFI